MPAQLSLDDIAVDARLEAAVAWKVANQAAYDQIVSWAREDIEAGAKPAIDLYANLLRRPHFARRLGLVRSDAVYALNNNLRADLARLVMSEHPDIVFEIRRARADGPMAVNARPVVPRP